VRSVSFPLGGLNAQVRFTGRTDGDLRITAPPDELAARRAAINPAPWTWLRQVHGATAITVSEPAGGAGSEADAAVTSRLGAVLAVHTADCVPVVLAAPTAEGAAVGVVHAGWRGLVAGVVEAAVLAMDGLGARPEEMKALVGPHIGRECYEFGAEDLKLVSDAVGAQVESHTAAGAATLDLAAATQAVLHRAGIHSIDKDGTCTAHPDGHFSHRARGDAGRQATVVWLEAF
jgi:hypothetical protein